MKIAIPSTSDGKVSPHFGHSEKVAIVNVEGNEIKSIYFEEMPDHTPGLIPQWLIERGVNVVLASGIGQKAIHYFSLGGVKVIAGVSPELECKVAAEKYLNGTLQTDDNLCDH